MKVKKVPEVFCTDSVLSALRDVATHAENPLAFSARRVNAQVRSGDEGKIWVHIRVFFPKLERVDILANDLALLVSLNLRHSAHPVGF